MISSKRHCFQGCRATTRNAAVFSRKRLFPKLAAAKTDTPELGQIAGSGGDESKCPVLSALRDAPEYKNRGILDTLELIFGDVLQYHSKQIQGRPVVNGFGANPAYYVSDLKLAREVLMDDDLFIPETPANDVLGPLAVLFLRGAKHTKVRSFLTPAFTAEELEKYAPKVQALTVKYFDKLVEMCDGGKPVQAYDNMRQLTFEIICYVVSGIEMSEEGYKQLFKDNKDMFAGVVTAILPKEWHEFLNLPFMPGGKALAARARVIELTRSKIREAQELLAQGVDVAGKGQLLELVARSMKAEEPLTEDELIDNMIVFVIAGFDTTSVLITCILMYVHKHPEYFQAVVEEQQALLAQYGEDMTPEVLRAMVKTDNFVKEVLRMKMPVPSIARKAVEDTALGGYRIKQGEFVVTPLQYMSVYDPLWSEAEGDLAPPVFNPNRYEGIRGGGAQTFPFGYGKHSCVGQPLAMLEAKVALAVLARGYEVRVTEMPKRFVNIPVVHPANGLPVVLTRVTLQAAPCMSKWQH